MSATPVFTVDRVSKRFRLFHERNQSVKASLLRRRRASYEEFWALRDVDIEVPEGATFGLVGENGSGKSTLLKCMAKILRPDSGTIRSRGRISALLELGAGFHPELSGRENVFLNGSILGLSRRDLKSRFDEIVDFAGLDRFIDTPVKNYSSGMFVRLGFSVAINVEPDILLVDEVLAVGDESFQRRCSEKFADLRSSGRTIVIVSHALESVRHLCDQVVWLEHGRVQAMGTPGNVIDNYIDTAHADAHDRRGDGQGGVGPLGRRWGSGEGRIHRMELLGPDGSAVTSVRTGDRVTFRFHYRAEEEIPKPVFGMAVHRIDGVHVTGPNTRDADCVPDSIQGEGHVDLTIDRLLLLPATYDVTASLFDYACSSPIDFCHRAFRFDVERGQPAESYGVVSLGGQWQLHGGRVAERTM